MEGKLAKIFGAKGTQSTPTLRLGLATLCLVMLCQCNPSLAKAVELADGETEVENHVYFMDDQNNMIPADLTVTQQEEYIALEHADMVYDFSSENHVYLMDDQNNMIPADLTVTQQEEYISLEHADMVYDFSSNHVYLMDDQNNMIPADLTVTQQEEYIALEHADMVYDFSSGLMVYKFKKSDESVKGCLVASFKLTETANPSEIKYNMGEGKVLGTVRPVTNRVTNVWLNKEVLGTKSQQLCAGEMIRFVEIIGDKGVADVSDDAMPNKRERREAITLILGIASFLWSIFG